MLTGIDSSFVYRFDFTSNKIHEKFGLDTTTCTLVDLKYSNDPKTGNAIVTVFYHGETKPIFSISAVNELSENNRGYITINTGKDYYVFRKVA